MVKKYVKKPVVVEAIEWTGKNIKDIYSFVGVENFSFNAKAVDQEIGDLHIKTLEGHMYASEGDFIIKGIKGEFYPCKPDIFHSTYDNYIEYRTCPDAETAMYILEFIKENYQKDCDEQWGVLKYIEALQMGIDAIKKTEKIKHLLDKNKNK